MDQYQRYGLFYSLYNPNRYGSKVHRLSAIELYCAKISSLKLECLKCEAETVLEFPLHFEAGVAFCHTVKCQNPSCQRTGKIWKSAIPDRNLAKYFDIFNLSGDFTIPYYWVPFHNVKWSGESWVNPEKYVRYPIDARREVGEEFGEWTMGPDMYEIVFGNCPPYDPPSIDKLFLKVVFIGRYALQDFIDVESDEDIVSSGTDSENESIDDDNASSNVSQAGDRDNFELDETNADNASLKKLVGIAKENLKKGVGPKEILDTLSGSHQENASALFEALLEGLEKGYAGHLPEKKSYLDAIVVEYSQLVLLRAVEEFFGTSKSNAVKEVAYVLKALYDDDILEEEYVVKWYEEGLNGENKRSSIWKNAKPFVGWLLTAESESEEE